jgi:hypothetical protein
MYFTMAKATNPGIIKATTTITSNKDGSDIQHPPLSLLSMAPKDAVLPQSDFLSFFGEGVFAGGVFGSGGAIRDPVISGLGVGTGWVSGGGGGAGLDLTTLLSF